MDEGKTNIVSDLSLLAFSMHERFLLMPEQPGHPIVREVFYEKNNQINR